MKMIVKPRNWNALYEELEGDTPFARAVNEKTKQYWLDTGHEMPIESAAFEVLSDLYNEFHAETLT